MKSEIIFEDADILVCAKPAGIAVQSARISEPDMVSELKNYLAKQSRKGPVYLGVVHRLDQPVSGIVVFAKSKKAAADLSRQITDHTMQKTYRAVVALPTAEAASEPEAADAASLPTARATESGTLIDYVVKEPGGGARVVSKETKDAKRAELSYHCLGQKDGRALMEIDLKTGRHHQIRVQMSHAGMPLLGDARYGNEESQNISRGLGIRNVQLQAVRLAFVHPVTRKKVCYELEKKLEL